MLGPDDILCVAGKGHETGQIVGGRTLPFSDHDAVKRALAGGGRVSAPLWTWDDFVAATGGRPQGPPPAAIAGISIDSRTIAPGEAFFAIRGDTFDGHDFVAMALARGAATAVVAEDKLAALGDARGSLTVVGDPLAALGGLARAARARSQARIAAVTGSVGKTGTKEMLAAALAADGPVHDSPASFNNHWGVPLTLARMPPSARYGVFEIGMNHAGEIEPLTKMVRPHVAIVTAIAPVHLEFFKDVEEIARAKAEIFLGVEPGGVAIVNRDSPHFALLAELAEAAKVARVIGFGEHPAGGGPPQRLQAQGAVLLHLGAHPRRRDLLQARRARPPPRPEQPGGAGRRLGARRRPRQGGAGACRHAGAQGARGASPSGRPPRRGDADRRKLQRQSGLDARRHRAARLRSAPGRHGRRIAVLGDMRELGEDAPAMHADLAGSLAEAGVDRVFLAGPLMAALWEKLPAIRRGAYGDSAADIEDALFEAIGPGDVVMVKGSNASRMGPLVDALTARFVPARAAQDRRQEEDAA